LGLAIAEKRNDLALTYHFVHKLGVEASHQADHRDAVPIVRRALKIARKLGDKTGIAQSLKNLGALYYELDDYPRARKLLTKTLPYLSETNDATLKGSVLSATGKIAAAMEEYAYACRVFAQALEALAEAQDTPLILETLTSISETLDKMNEKSLALTIARFVVNHPETPAEISQKAIRLRENLLAKYVSPEKRDWSAERLRKITDDVIEILTRKAKGS
jgi:tetratricopeptide (TPR) repeat protein